MYKQLGRRFWGYTYQEMEKDLEIFARAFPETMKLKTLGKTLYLVIWPFLCLLMPRMNFP